VRKCVSAFSAGIIQEENPKSESQILQRIQRTRDFFNTDLDVDPRRERTRECQTELRKKNSGYRSERRVPKVVGYVDDVKCKILAEGARCTRFDLRLHASSCYVERHEGGTVAPASVI